MTRAITRFTKRFTTLAALAAAPLLSAELVLPSTVLERDQTITVLYRTALQATGKGTLQVNWSDGYGRMVEDRSIPLNLRDENEIRFPLDLKHAVAMQNELRVHFSLDGANKKGERDHREEDAQGSFVARPGSPTWSDYQIIMWQDGTPQHVAGLEQIGVNAGKSAERSTSALPESLLKNDLRWYVENLATDFYSEYHRFRRDRPYNWSLLQAKELYKRDPASKEGLKRHPSFSDPQWLSEIRERLARAARTYSPYRPIFYNLADESGIAELAGFWDFDFSDHSLDAMRRWLQKKYGTLAALNRQWGSAFETWEAVTPETTREAMRRNDENYSSWSDHKEWMDVSFADALKTGADAIHSVDPQAYVGIEGAQMPGWGGYDYSRLTSALDAMEPYDIGENVEIIRSLNPKVAFVTTSFATGPWEKHRVWYELLHGARGQIIWDEKNDIVLPDGSLGPRGREVAPYWNELRNGVAALLMNSERQANSIAIHYSQASMRAEWMRAQRPKGDAWMERMSWTERKDSDFLQLRDSYCRLLEDQGLQYNFVAYGQVEQGELLKRGYRVLILPRSSALSPLEAAAITAFVRQGGTLVVDGEAGIFDEHVRRLEHSSLSRVLDGDVGLGRVVRLDAIAYHHQRVLGTEAQLHAAMGKILSQAGVQADFRVTDAHGQPVVGVEVHTFRNGGATIIGLHSNPQLSVDELGPPEFRSNKRFEKAQAVRLTSPEMVYAYDIRRGKPLGHAKQFAFTVDPYEPTLIALTSTAIPALRVAAPESVDRGAIGRIGISLGGESPAARPLFRVEVRNAAGDPVRYYSGNLAAPGGSADVAIPFAQSDVPGKWSVSVQDLLSGQRQTAELTVR